MTPAADGAGTPANGTVAAAVGGDELFVPPLSAQTLAAVQHALRRYPRPASAILPALWAVQDQYGWLPPAAMAGVADVLGLRPSEVQAVATFYSMYFQRPAGRHHVIVCVNAPCALRGADDVCAHLERTLGVPSKGTTPDGEFTWEATIECLGACGYAPMMQVDHVFHENLTAQRIDAALAAVRGAPSHAARGRHRAPAERDAAAGLAASSTEPAGRAVAVERRGSDIVDLDTGHTLPPASPALTEVAEPAPEVPPTPAAAELAGGDAALLAESEVVRAPSAPAVDGAMPGFTEQLAPGAERGPEQAPRDPAEAAGQRTGERRRRRGRRR